MIASVDQALALLPRAISVTGTAIRMPDRNHLMAAYEAVRAVRQSLPQQVVRFPWGTRATALLQQAEFQLQQYQRTGGSALAPPLVPGRSGGPFGPMTAMGPVFSPVAPAPHTGAGGRRWGVYQSVLPTLYAVRQLLQRGRLEGQAAEMGRPIQSPAAALTGLGEAAPLLEAVVKAEKELGPDHPVTKSLILARADALTAEKLARKRAQAQRVKGEGKPLPIRILRAAFKASLVFGMLRFIDVQPKKAVLVSVALGGAVEWLGLEDTIKHGSLSVVRSVAGGAFE